MKARPTYTKRQRERDKAERKKRKAEKRDERKEDRKTRQSDGDEEEEDPDIAGIVPGPQKLDEELFGELARDKRDPN